MTGKGFTVQAVEENRRGEGAERQEDKVITGNDESLVGQLKMIVTPTGSQQVEANGSNNLVCYIT